MVGTALHTLHPESVVECALPSALPQPRSPKVAKAHNVVSFAIIVVWRPLLFADNVVSKLPCLQFEAFMFAVR